MIDKNIIRLFGVSMHAWSMAESVQAIRERLEAGLFTQHVVVSAGKLVNMQSDTVLAESVSSCDMINIDGAGVVAVAKLFGHAVPERVAGTDLFLQLLVMAEQYHHSVYFLGAEQQIIEETVDRISRDYPALEIAGYHHGYFWDNEIEVVQDIAASGAEMLFVAVTSPKKENFIHQWNAELGVKFVMGVGGTFDVVAGKVKRAPLWMQHWALEWLYRVIQEPRRLWKRYLITNSIFLWMVIRGCVNGDYQKNGGNPSIVKKTVVADTIDMFDLLFQACSLNQAAELIVQDGIDRRKGLVVTPNVDHLVKLQKDPLMKEIFHAAKYRFADGMPLVWFSKMFMHPSLTERVTGADLLPAVAALAAEKKVKIFLLGGNPGVAIMAADQLTKKNPELEVAGVYCPPFGFEFDKEESLHIVDIINASGADILFIGVGAPKQEKWAYQYLDQLQVGPILGVGAALDFTAGTIHRSPRILQKMGAEWLYRLLHDPKRLWRRYLLEDTRFLSLAFKEWRKLKRKQRDEHL